MSTFARRHDYGDDAEYDNWVEKQIDPEWTGVETDPLGWMADRAQSRAERDRGAAESVLVVGIALAVAGFWLASRLQPWQIVGLLTLSAYALGCWVMVRGARHGVAVRDRLDAEAPKRWDR